MSVYTWFVRNVLPSLLDAAGILGRISKKVKTLARSPPSEWAGVTRGYDAMAREMVGWTRRFRGPGRLSVSVGTLDALAVARARRGALFYEHETDGGSHVVVSASPHDVDLGGTAEKRPRSVLAARFVWFQTRREACRGEVGEIEELREPAHTSPDVSEFLNLRRWTIHARGIPTRTLEASADIRGLIRTPPASSLLRCELVVVLDDIAELTFKEDGVVSW